MKSGTNNNAGRMPESRMVLRLVPYAMRADRADDVGDDKPPVIVNYAANLDHLPDGAKISDLPIPPAANLPGAPLPPLAVEIIVQPIVTTDADGNDVLTFSLNAQLPGHLGEGSEEAEPQEPLSPWKHDMHSDAVNECVVRVRSAAPNDRYQRLTELADAMMAPLGSQE